MHIKIFIINRDLFDLVNVENFDIILMHSSTEDLDEILTELIKYSNHCLLIK